jgi:hypothetical protein
MGGAPLTDQPIAWEHTGDGEFPYRARVSEAGLLIRVNDFPAEPLYTLLVNGQPGCDLDDWPACWARPGTPPRLLRAAGLAQARRGRVDAIVAAAWAATLCLLPRGPAEQAVAALELPGTLAGPVQTGTGGRRRLEPPPPGTSCLEFSESRGDVFTLTVVPVFAPPRSSLDALLGAGTSVPRVHYDQPYQVCYRISADDAPYSCDIFARFTQSPDREDAAAQSLMFRRQARLRPASGSASRPSFKPSLRPGRAQAGRDGTGSAPRPGQC